MENTLVYKTQCPTCAATGKDTSKDNMAVYSDGQTHCFSCNEHGFVEHSKNVSFSFKKATKEDISDDDDWMDEYRGEFYALPDRKLRAETLEKYRVKAEKNDKGDVIKHHYPYHNEKGEMVGIKTRMVINKKFFASGSTNNKNQLFGQHLD